MKLQWTFPKIYNLGLGNGEVYMDLKLIHHYKKLGSIWRIRLFVFVSWITHPLAKILFVNRYIIGKYLHLILFEFLSSPSSCLDSLLTYWKVIFSCSKFLINFIVQCVMRHRCKPVLLPTPSLLHAFDTPRLRQTIPSVLFEVNFIMKRTNNSGISQARVRRIRREANRNVNVLNLSVC
jgi:hypothetical protein